MPSRGGDFGALGGGAEPGAPGAAETRAAGAAHGRCRVPGAAWEKKPGEWPHGRPLWVLFLWNQIPPSNCLMQYPMEYTPLVGEIWSPK